MAGRSTFRLHADFSPAGRLNTISYIKENTTHLMIQAVSSSETSVSVYQTTWCYISEDSYLHDVNLADEMVTVKFFWRQTDIRHSGKSG
jgi:hypothetical protein